MSKKKIILECHKIIKPVRSNDTITKGRKIKMQ